MKQLIVIVNANQRQDIVDRLRTLNCVSGFTLTQGEGHGPGAMQDAFLSARDRVCGHVPTVRLEMLLADEVVDGVLTALRDLRRDTGRGRYWVTDVIDSGTL